MNNPRRHGLFQWVFLISLCLFAFQQCTNAQGTPPQKVNSNYQFKSVGSDSGGVRLPIYATLPANPSANYVDDGALAFQSSDSSVYQWHVLPHIWTRVGFSPAPPDSSAQFNNHGNFGGNSSFVYSPARHVVLSDSNASFLYRIRNLKNNDTKLLFNLTQADTVTGNRPYSVFSHTIDQSGINSDGQIDAAYSWGYNWNGQSKINPNECAWATTIESHWIQAGVTQAEYYQTFQSKAGTSDRVIGYNANINTGNIDAKFTMDNITFVGSQSAGSPGYMGIGDGGALSIQGSVTGITCLSNDLSLNGGFTIRPVLSSNGTVAFSNSSTNASSKMQFNTQGEEFVGNHLVNGTSVHLFRSNVTPDASGIFSIYNNNVPGSEIFSMLAQQNGIVFFPNRVAIGKPSNITASAAFEVVSSTQGFLPPKMTTVQKLAISSPTEGLQVYDLTLHQMSYYNGTTWVNF